MTKKFLTFGILLIVLLGGFTIPMNVSAAIGDKCTVSGVPGIIGGDEVNGYSCVATNSPVGKTTTPTGNTINPNATDTDSGIGDWIWKKFAQGIGYVLITISSLALLLSGWVFDEVVKFTILDMAKNLGGGAGGVGDAITTAWATLRDIANMCFIFVLLFAAFKAMFDTNFGNFGTTVKNIIIVALLINFSLFFSKVVIDASNVVAVGFYKSITNTSVTYNTNTTRDSKFEKSISAGYMNMLGLQTFFGSNILTNGKLDDGGQILTVGIITAAFMLITTVILLIAGIMFIARFIILVFLMILSPLALIAFIIPGQSKHFDSWFDSLKNQSFFAPLYFALTWVVFKVGSSLIGVLGKPTVQWAEIATNPKGVIPLIINYVLIIGFSIAALVISKQMATSGATGGAFKAISGGIGTAAIGGAALVGRNSAGKFGNYIANNRWLREKAPDSRLARTALAIGEKTGAASFDLRASSGLKKIGLSETFSEMGKAGGKGGYLAERESKIKKRMEFMERNLQDNVTGADLEKEMEKIGYGKEENRKLKRTAAEVEAKRRDIQAQLTSDAKNNTQQRKERYLHNLSQTRFVTPNMYSGIYEDAEAARRMRDNQKSKSNKDKLADLIKEMTKEEEGGGSNESASSGSSQGGKPSQPTPQSKP